MDVKDVVESIHRLEDKMVELISKQAEHNAILSEHKGYSLALQAEQKKINEKIEPMEKEVHLMSTLFKAIGMILVGVLIQWGIKFTSFFK